MATMTTSQRNNLTPAAGMVVHNTTANALNYYNGSSWVAVSVI
jgi:hypothetical protein